MFHVFAETSLLWPFFPPTNIFKFASPPPLALNLYLEKLGEFIPRPLYGLRKILSFSICFYRDLKEIQDLCSSTGLYKDLEEIQDLNSCIGLYRDLEKFRAPL